MDTYTILFWFSSISFFVLSMSFMGNPRLLPLILAGAGMFATSKIGRKFLGL
jgi:hypothetical protein